MKKVFLLVFLALFLAAGAFAQNIGRVEQNGRNFVILNETGGRIASQRIGRGSHILAGWGRDFFVVRYGNTIQTHDTRGRQIASWNIEGIARGVTISSVSIANDQVSVFTVAGGNIPAARLDRQLRTLN